MYNNFDPEQLDYPVLIDGGLSNQLRDQGCDINHKLWTAKLLDENPKSIVDAHLAYLQAGAEVLITSSYQASVEGFVSQGHSQSRAIELILLTVELAREAENQFRKTFNAGQRILIAASIGPYGAFLADGSEYTGNYSVSDAELTGFHSERIKILEKSSADFFACETIPSYREACVLNELLRISSKFSWVTFSCRDSDFLHDGTRIAEAAGLFETNPKVFAVGVNCTSPEYIPAIICKVAEGCPSKRIVVYPNSGEQYNPQDKSWTGQSASSLFALQMTDWLRNGADIVGGCCRTGPDHIASMSSLLKSLR